MDGGGRGEITKRNDTAAAVCGGPSLNYAAVSGGGGGGGGGGESRKGEREERKRTNEKEGRKEGSADCELSPLAKAM